MGHIFKLTVVLIALIQSLVVSQTSLAYCPDATRPHASRCDQYLRCDNLANGDHVWTTVQCHKGLVYRQYIGTCVVPDNDWECDLSAEDDRNTSDENVYGIDNLQYSGPSSTALDDGMELSRAIFPDDQESSGDGGLDHTLDDPEASSPNTAENSSVSHLNESSVTSTTKPVTKPTDDSSETALQQLKKLIKHQQNWINTQMKRRNFLSGENGFLSATSSQEAHARIPTRNSETPATNTEAPRPAPGIVSEDIIRNLLNISQQLISNQKEASALRTNAEKKPIVTPIYIPVPVGPTFHSSQPDYSTKILNNSQDPPVGVSLMNAYNIPQNYYTPQGTLATRLQPNESIPQGPILYDGYGNQVLPLPSYPQFGPFNPYQNPVQNPYTAQRLEQPNSPYNTPISGGFPGNGPAPQAPFGSQGSYNNFQHLNPSVNYNRPPNNNFHQYGGPSANYNQQPDYAAQLASFNRNELLDQTGSQDSDADESSNESDYVESKPSAAAISDELELTDSGESDGSTSHLQLKLFALGDDTTLDYEQYKDSLMPMLEANPDDGRISLLTCSLGSRQPNRTDCFRYYVCNPHNGMFQTFTCPSNTAFNKATRLCDTVSYKPCQLLKTQQQNQQPQQLLRQQGLSKRRKTHRKQQKNPTEKELLRTAQKYVALIRREALKVLQRTNDAQQSVPLMVRRKAALSGSTKLVTRRTTPTPTVQKTPTTKATRTAPRCRVEGRMADPADIHNYYLCHRKNPKKFTKLKMACPADLIYCATSQYCTLAANC